jgi:hypothetical protein
MLARARFALLAALAGGVLEGCDGRPCLHSDCSTIDSIAANVRLCGFPRDQIDGILSGQGFSTGIVHVGQRIPLRLRGDLDRVVSITWRVDSQSYAQNPPRVSLVPLSNTTAMLTGLATGGPDRTDYVFVAADLVFRDGTESVATVAYCPGDGFIPADHVFVVP